MRILHVVLEKKMFFPLAMTYSMWDLSFPTRDQTYTPCIGST